MPKYQYVIVGGGMTADAAVAGIRAVDASGSVGIICSESHRPYRRPPLSKALWKGDPLESVWTATPYGGVDIHTSRSAVRIDTNKKIVVDDTGTNYAYDKLLLATGGRVRRLPQTPEGIIYFRTLDDYRSLKALTERGQRFAVIGGGFIGSEIAAALSMNGMSVTMIFPEDGIGARVYPAALSQFLNSHFSSKGVEILAGESVASIEARGGGYRVTTGSGKTVDVDGIVAGLGIQPNVEIAQSAGIEVGNGILVDEHLQTSVPDIYAAGDVANFYSSALEMRMRVEHEDNANAMGRAAGEIMAGRPVVYHHLPSFYSDLFELGYEAVGELDARLETVAEWKEEFKEGIVYYMRDGKLRGVLSWNVWGQVEAARDLIAQKGPINKESVKGLLIV